MAQTFDIPIDVPWTPIAVSPDMMDTGFCDGGFPPAWRSSLAIYAYEPPPGDLPTAICNQKITYLKLTCSITGYQPTADEVTQLGFLTPIKTGSPGSPDNVEVPLPSIPADVAEDLVSDYYACYGVLLNVAVFPSTTTVLSTTPVANVYAFAGSPRHLPNPFRDRGLQFLASKGNFLDLRKAGGRLGLLIAQSVQLQIDLPPSTNVVLKVFIPNDGAKGTVTAYLNGSVVFTAPLPKAKLGIQDVPIVTTSSVTQVAIQQMTQESFLVGLTYDYGEREVTLADYPHVIDFEPKTRDLYQAATDQSEVLTGSNSTVSVGKAQQNTSSSEMGITQSTGFNSQYGSGSTALTSGWGETASDGRNTQADASRERRETQGATTNITQQYNLLTGYHAGTNRAAFLMLPRPHTLQATDYRTFVRGLRMIEGIQEFLLIVSRPKALPGICIEATLETGHFPEDVQLQQPPVVQPIRNTFPFSFTLGGPSGDWSHSSGITYTITQTMALPPGWTLDPTKGSWSALRGVDYSFAPISGDTASSPEYKQATVSLKTVVLSSDQSSVTIQSSCNSTGPQNIDGSGTAAWVQLNFTLYGMQIPQSTSPADSEHVVISPFLVTSRELCVCIHSCPTDNCVIVDPPQQVPYSASPGENVGITTGGGGAPTQQSGVDLNARAKALAGVQAKRPTVVAAGLPGTGPSSASTKSGTAMPQGHQTGARSSIVYETKLTLPRSLLASSNLEKSRTPAARELTHAIQHHLLNNWRKPERRPHGAVGFLESDYLCERLVDRLPADYLARPVSAVTGISKKTLQLLGKKATIGDVLRLSLYRLRTLTDSDLGEAVRMRRRLLGFLENSANKDSSASEFTDSKGAATLSPRPRRRSRA